MADEPLGLDTNALRALLNRDLAILAAIGSSELCLPAIVLNESIEGWSDQIRRCDSRHQEVRYAETVNRMCEAHELLRALPILRYTEAAQRVYAGLRHGRGNRSRNDLRIAAICIAHEVPLLTRNVRDFEDLPGLSVETW